MFSVFSAIRMTYLPSAFLNELRTNKYVKGISYIEELIEINWNNLMDKHIGLVANSGSFEPEPGPRLPSTEIWALNLSYHNKMEIQV